MTKRLLSIVVAAIMVLSLVPMTVLAGTDRAAEVKDGRTVTYTGENVTVTDPAVGDKFNWTLSVSEASGLYSGQWLIDYDETYLTTDYISETWSGSIIGMINAITENSGDPGTDKPDFDWTSSTNGNYQETGSHPEAVAGNWYTNIGMHLTTFDHEGLQMGGPMFRIRYKWTAVPTESVVLPMNTIVVNSTYFIHTTVIIDGEEQETIGGAAFDPANITSTPGSVTVTITTTPEPTDPPTPTEPPVTEDRIFQLVTNEADITPSGDYVIYGVNGTYTGAMNGTISNGRMGATAVTVTDDKIINPDSSVIWHFEEAEDGSIAICNDANSVYCVISAATTSGFSTQEDPENGYNITMGDDNKVYMKTSIADGAERNICIYRTDFRPYADDNYKPLYLYKYVTEPVVTDHSVTYTGDTVEVEDPAVGDTFYWTMSVSDNSGLYAGQWLVDYDETYFTCTEANASWSGGITSQINETWDEGEAYSDKPFFSATAVYEGQSGGNPVGEAGNYYTLVGMFLTSNDYNGVQMGGKMIRMTYQWVTVPTESMDIPMPVEVITSSYMTGTKGSAPHDPVTVVDGLIKVTVSEPVEHPVTYTGETLTVDDPAVDSTFYWTLSVSENSGLYAGQWLVDYDENYLTCTEANASWSGGITSQINETWDEGEAYSDKPFFSATAVYEGQTGGNPCGEAGNLYTLIGMFLTSNDYNGVQMGGKMIRMTYKWIAIPTDEQLSHDENGYYLPMPVEVITSSYMTGTKGSAPHDPVTVVDGKVYITRAENYTLTINYIYADGSEAAPTHTETLAAGASYEVASPEITGYTPDVAVVSGTMEGDVTVVVTYTANQYTITWVIDGVEETETYAYGATPAHATPTKEADAQYTYTFAGWDPEIAAVTGDATYTATWTQTLNEYTVTFVDHDGTVLKTETVAYGSAATAPADPTWEGHTFAGWDKDFSNITGDLTVTALYDEIIYHTVTFVDGLTGETISTVTVEDGASATAPTAPTHEGYTFTGWEGEYSNVTADVTVTAQYSVNNYTITIYYLRWSDALEDWVALQSSKTVTVAYNTEYDVNDQIPATIGEYVYDHADAEFTGTMPAQNIEINVYYVIPYEPVAPTVAFEKAEIRERTDGDTKKDLRFLFVITYNDSCITYDGVTYGPTTEYYVITKYQATLNAGGSPLVVNGKNLYSAGETSCEFSAVLKNIPEKYFDTTISATPYIEYTLDGETGSMTGETSTTTVNEVLMGAD